VDRRGFLKASAAAAAGLAARLPDRLAGAAPTVCEPPAPFDPKAWCAARGQGLLKTKTPQSNLPLRGVASSKLKTWKTERTKYLDAFRELIGPWPARPPLAPVELERYEDAAFTRVKVSYRSLSGEPHAQEIRAWLFLPKGHPGPRPAIVTLHQTVLQGKDEPAGLNATLPWLTFADHYARLGYVTLAPDAIGYGERTKGCNAEQGFELADAWSILQSRPEMTLLGLMLFDTTRAVDFLAQRPEVDPARIGVMGHSQGGFLTNMVLGLEPRFKVGVASCGYGIFRSDAFFPERWAGPQSAYLPRLALYNPNRNALPVDHLQLMALAAPAAHLVQTAMADTIWTPSAVAPDPFVAKELRRVHGFYGSAGNFVSLEENGDHGWYPDAQTAADELFARILRP
jgi:dienelactone hydrolase